MERLNRELVHGSCKREEHLPPVVQCLSAAIQLELNKTPCRGVVNIQGIAFQARSLPPVKPFLTITPGAVLQVRANPKPANAEPEPLSRKPNIISTASCLCSG